MLVILVVAILLLLVLVLAPSCKEGYLYSSIYPYRRHRRHRTFYNYSPYRWCTPYGCSMYGTAWQ